MLIQITAEITARLGQTERQLRHPRQTQWCRRHGEKRRMKNQNHTAVRYGRRLKLKLIQQRQFKKTNAQIDTMIGQGFQQLIGAQHRHLVAHIWIARLGLLQQLRQRETALGHDTDT